jgi:hypothetical protein
MTRGFCFLGMLVVTTGAVQACSSSEFTAGDQKGAGRAGAVGDAGNGGKGGIGGKGGSSSGTGGGDDGGGDDGGAGNGGSAAPGGANSGGGGSSGQAVGGSNAGGSNAGGSNAGGSNAGEGASGTGGTGGSAGNGTGALHLLWMVNPGKAAVVELDRESGDEIGEQTFETPFLTGEARDLAVHPDGRLRLLWGFNTGTAELWALDGATHTIDKNFMHEGALWYVAYARGRDADGRLVIQELDGYHLYRTSDDNITGRSMPHPIFALNTQQISDYWVLPDGGRLLMSASEATLVRIRDATDNDTGARIECAHPGYQAVSYSVASDGVVWASYAAGSSVRVCAYANEAAVDCDLSNDGWGPGACRDYTYGDPAYFFADLAVPP